MRSTFAALLSCLVAGALASPLASAAPIAIANAGFEADAAANGAFVVLTPQGWSVYDPSSIIDGASNAVGVIFPNVGGEYFPGGAPEGNNAALVFLAGGQAAEAGLQQTLSATLQANTRYTLSVQVGNIASGTSLPGSSGGAGVFFDLDGFPGYRIDLMAGGTVLASDDNTLAGAIPEGEFRLSSFDFVTGLVHAQLGEELGIRLVNLKAPGTADVPNIEVDFDDVQLTASSVPEPSTLALLLGAAIFGYARRRRVLNGFSRVNP